MNDDKKRRYKYNEQMCNDTLNLCKKNDMKLVEEDIDRKNRSIATKPRI